MNIFFGLFETLGDIIVSTAIVRAIKEKYPDSKIVYAVGEQYVEVLRGNPDIAEIMPTKHPWEIVLRSAEKNYDKVYLPLMLTHEDTVWHQREPWCIANGDNHNLVDMYAKKCQDDIKITNRRTYVYPHESAWKEIVDSAGDMAETFEKTPFITIHTTSRNSSKDWPYENFVKLTQLISAKYGNKLAIYQIGGKDDKPLPEPSKCVNGMPLTHTMALIGKSKLHIDIDSGPSFIADSLNVPTICIMGATWAQTSGPIGPNVEFIEPNRHCLDRIHTPCHSHCVVAPDCIKSIEVSEVFNAVDQKLQEILKD